MINKENTYNLLISDKILNYMIVGLEFYTVMLNNSICILDMDIDLKNEQYADCFYTYHYLASFSKSYRSRIRLQKPDKRYKEDKILYFLKQKDQIKIS